MPRVNTTKGVMHTDDLVVADIAQPWKEGEVVRLVATEWRLKAPDAEGNPTNAGGELVRRDVWVNPIMPQELAALPNL